MRKTILTILMMSVMASAASAACLLDSLEYTFRLGYNIGGTAPIGMPATIRSLNKYDLKANFSLGVDVHKRITPQWGVLTGLHLDRKGMEIDATVKNYHMAMAKDDSEIEGYYTGNLVTKCDEWMLTLPLMATLNISEKVMLKGGPYVSYVTSKSFEGHVYDGYLRENDPTGEKIEMGNTNETRGTFDFSDKMRRFQTGVDIGVDWQIGTHWGAYADLQWGLSGIHHSSFKTIEQTLYPIYGTLGVIYKINNKRKL